MALDPIIGGALISTGGQLLGGLLGGGGDGFDISENLKYERKKYKAAVQGAKAAGLHPLFALGGSAGLSPTATIPGQSMTGSHIASAAATLGDAVQKKALRAGEAPLREAQLNAVNASAARDEAAAALDLSRAKREEVEALQKPPTPTNPDHPPLYIRAKNPLTGEVVWLPNPDLGLEMPESVGGAYWMRGKYYDASGKEIGGQRPKNYPKTYGTGRGGRWYDQ